MNDKNYRFTNEEAREFRLVALAEPNLSAYDIWHKHEVIGRALNIKRIVNGETFEHIETPISFISLSHHSLLNMVGQRHGNHKVISIARQQDEVQLQCLTCGVLEPISFKRYHKLYNNGIALICEHCKYLNSEFVGEYSYEEWKDGALRGTLPCTVNNCLNMAIPNSNMCRRCNTLNTILERSFNSTLEEYLYEVIGEDDEE